MAQTVRDLDVPNKKHMKAQRLEQYQRRHFELTLDQEALKAAGDTSGIEELYGRMAGLELAYEAIKAIDIKEDEL